MEIHYVWTLWFQNKRTNRPGANVNSIVICLFVIFQILSQKWITMEENFKLIPLFNRRNLSLLDASKVKQFAN